MLRLLQDASKRSVRAPASRADEELDGTEPRAMLCGVCRAAITTRAARIVVHGAHEHRRVNPSNVSFHLGCFATAPGCVIEGEPTMFWSWFPGYAWQIASCRACGEHLGWAFTGDSTFFGLILPRMIEAEDE